MLRANAGFVRFKPDGDPSTCVFQCGISTPTIPASPGFMGGNFTAFQCAEDMYDTTVYISNRSALDRRVSVKITNAEDGQVVADTFVTIGPWKMLAFSLAGALR